MKGLKHFERSGNNRGSYSVEGAITLTIFTICLLALMSILSVVKVEGEVQDALNETAMELSQYSYVLGRSTFLKDAAEDHMEGLGLVVELDEKEFSDLALTGPLAAKKLTKTNFSREDPDTWLKEQGVEGGYSGLNFEDTMVLMDGKTITVAVTYKLKVNTYGLFEKVLTIHEAAVTYGLLPTDSALKKKSGSEGSASIWKQTNFVRGQYFANLIRTEGNGGKAVKTGQGIDLYDQNTGHYTSVYSVNLFSATYAEGDPETGAASYRPKEEEIQKLLFGYSKKMNQSVSGLGNDVVLADGTSVPAVTPKKKTLVLVVPEEAKENGAMQTVLHSVAVQAEKKYGVSMTFRYEQTALS